MSLCGSPDNLLNVYSQATRYERDQGDHYYTYQRQRLEQLSRDLDFSVEAAIGAFAALSPNNREEDTYRDLENCMAHVQGATRDTPRVSTYGHNLRKALAILRGRHPELILKGHKVRSFYYNTIDPKTSLWVTVDGHVVSAWTGMRLLMKTDARISDTQYRRISDDVRTAAKRVSVLP